MTIGSKEHNSNLNGVFTMQFQQYRRLQFSCTLMVCAWIIIICFISVGVMISFFNATTYNIFIGIFGYSSILIIVLFVLFSLNLRCKVCGKSILLHQNRSISPNKLLTLDPWAVTVIDVLRRGKFRCAHCCQEYECGPWR